MNILGIDTSCDDTAVAVVRDGRTILANVVRSQLRAHAQYGGVVPEVAGRAHLGDIASVMDEALDGAGIALADLDAIGVTYGPGLGGSLLVGVSFAKGLALARDLPLLPVNHLEGHVYSNWLIPAGVEEQAEPRFPVLVLIVSGGHTELLLMREHCRYEWLGGTRDDAAGEAFDKVGRGLGLDFPGGPAIQRVAEGYTGDMPRLPRAWLRGTYDFSFSGLKTAVWQMVQEQGSAADIVAIAASFQESVVDVLAFKVMKAAHEFGAATVAICGGVAANTALRARVASDLLVPMYVPPIALCMDNGAMIAAAAYYRRRYPRVSPEDADPLEVEVDPGLALPVMQIT